jgi:glycosyltransferase involved in cell wall biosynthesis
VRVAIVTESFLPVVNGVSNSVQRILEHLSRRGHSALVLAPGAGPDSHAGFPVVRVPALDLPVVDSVPVGVPTRRIHTALAGRCTCGSGAWTPTGSPRGELLVGYVGRLAPEKRVHRLAALHGLPGVRLVIIGDGPDRRALQARLPGAAFLGFRTGDDLASAYASLDVFVHTGPFETFCQAVQEALASGLPVVAPDAGGPRDLVTPGRTGFLVPAGDDNILRGAVRALADAGLRRRFGAAARTSVLDRTWPAVCDELLGHYAAVTAQHTSQAA